MHITDEQVERAARKVASKHYADRFGKPEDDPHVQMNVDGNWSVFAADARLALLAALAPVEPVAVKKLEWHISQMDGRSFIASNGFGENYVVRELADGYRAAGKDYDTADEAKAGAQADFERRIRSALTSPPSTPSEDDLGAALAEHRNWELSCGEDPQMEGEMRWHVHAVNGGRNDREWTLIGFGETPSEAIRAAIRNERAGGGKP